jgi:hypothetical protein
VLKWRNLLKFSVLVKMPPSKLSANKTAFYNTGGGLSIQGFFAQSADGDQAFCWTFSSAYGKKHPNVNDYYLVRTNQQT